MEIFLDILSGLLFLIIIVSWVAFAVCLVNVGRLSQKARARGEQGCSFIPFSGFFGTYDDERITFWRNGLIMWFLIFLGLAAGSAFIDWLIGHHR